MKISLKNDKNSKTKIMDTLEIYVVRNYQGKYLPVKNYRGHDWTYDIKFARIYTKLGPARTQVTQWANNKPKDPVPVILKMTATITEIMDEPERVKEANERKIKEEKAKEIRRAEWAIKHAKQVLEKAKQNMADAQTRHDQTDLYREFKYEQKNYRSF